MTVKQENILKAALELFARHGYAATSTSKVAKAAGVSEGLIFRHFESKEGLLNAIMEQAQESATKEFSVVLQESDPKAVIKGVLEMPLRMEGRLHAWKLIYSLKWQTEKYDTSGTTVIKNALIEAFTKLGYADPGAESDAIMIQLDGIASAVLLRKSDNIEGVLRVLLEKYGI